MSLAVVIDANKVFAAALRPGRVRRLLYLLEGVEFYASEYLLDEVREHARELASRAGIDSMQFLAIVEEVLAARVKLHRIGCAVCIEKARFVASRFDPDDWPFIALAIEPGAVIWTNDKALIVNRLESGHYLAVDTEELVELVTRGTRSAQRLMREKYLASR
ncbi:PIN domain-containing protein [Pyrodictium abyssi]|uniref:PIN domain-containing protein n=1 Tax=Pyrodictium abyssi TaxID=54256 RepID=A0ABN6ZRI4_9CREN|nr:hypothetical protein PABY_05920 [Pyrodictium abyssi]